MTLNFTHGHVCGLKYHTVLGLWLFKKKCNLGIRKHILFLLIIYLVLSFGHAMQHVGS